MAKIDFPSNVEIGYVYETVSGQKWRWDGISWNSIASSNLSGIDLSEYQLKNQLQGIVIGDLIPVGDNTVDLGTSTLRFSELNSISLRLGTSVLTTDESGDLFLDRSDGSSPIKLSGSSTGSGISLSDLDANTLSPSGTGSLAYNNSSGVFTYTPPDLSSYLTSVDLTQVDEHLNIDSAGEGQVLSYTNGDYVWVDQSSGGGGSLVTLTAANSAESGSSLVLVGLGSDENLDLSSHITFTSGSSITINSMPENFHLLSLTYFRSNLANSANFEIIYPTNLIKSGLHEPLYWNSYRLDQHFDLSTNGFWDYWKKNPSINDSWSMIPNDANVDTMKGSVAGLASTGKYKFHLRFN